MEHVRARGEEEEEPQACLRRGSNLDRLRVAHLFGLDGCPDGPGGDGDEDENVADGEDRRDDVEGTELDQRDVIVKPDGVEADGDKHPESKEARGTDGLAAAVAGIFGDGECPHGAEEAPRMRVREYIHEVKHVEAGAIKSRRPHREELRRAVDQMAEDGRQDEVEKEEDAVHAVRDVDLLIDGRVPLAA